MNQNVHVSPLNMMKNKNLVMLCKADKAYKTHLRIKIVINFESQRKEHAGIKQDIHGKHGVE